MIPEAMVELEWWAFVKNKGERRSRLVFERLGGTFEELAGRKYLTAKEIWAIAR